MTERAIISLLVVVVVYLAVLKVEDIWNKKKKRGWKL